jgi:protein TonB
MSWRKSYPWILSLILHVGAFCLLLYFWQPFGPGDEIALSLLPGQSSGTAAAAAAANPSRGEQKTVPAARAQSLPENRDLPVEQPPPADEQVSGKGDSAEEAQEDPLVFTEEGSGGEVSARIGWQGGAREIVRRPAFPFPRVLSSSGQEADCTARITVTPLGMVSKVEIMNTSGYTEIDAGVVSALRGYVFSRDYGVEKRNAVAVVMFRFRLETLD